MTRELVKEIINEVKSKAKRQGVVVQAHTWLKLEEVISTYSDEAIREDRIRVLREVDRILGMYGIYL